MHTSFEQWIIIIFLLRESIKPAEILRRLIAQFAVKRFSRTQVNGWYKTISSGRESVQTEIHVRRQRTSTNEMNILAIHEMIEGLNRP